MTIDRAAQAPIGRGRTRRGGTAARGAAAGATAMMFVGSSVAVSAGLAQAPICTVQAVRYALACAVLLAIARVGGVRIPRPRRAELGWLVGVCVSGLVLFNLALVRGGAHAEPAVFAVAIACVPMVLALGETWQSKRRASGHTMLAAVVVSAGAVLVAGFGRADALGIALAVGVLICEAGFTLLAVPVLARLGPFAVSVHTTWLAALIFGFAGLASEGPGGVTTLTASDLLATGYLSLGVTAAAFVLWYSCVARLGAGRAGLLTAVAPVAAVLSGVALGGPAPSLPVWSGIGAIAIGLLLGLRTPVDHLDPGPHPRGRARDGRQRRG